MIAKHVVGGRKLGRSNEAAMETSRALSASCSGQVSRRDPFGMLPAF